MAEIKKHLIDFIGANTWEELCREAVASWRIQAFALLAGSGGQRLDSQSTN